MFPTTETRGRAVCFALLAFCGFRLGAADVDFKIPPLPVRLDIDGRQLNLIVSGTVTQVSAGPQEVALRLKLDADLSDFQHNLTGLLRAKLDQSEKCGDRITVQDAALVPAGASGTLTVHLHYEKFACAKIAGHEITKRLVGGDGAIVVRLTPQVDEGNPPKLAAEVISLDATGQLGEMLRSGPLGDALREKIRNSVVSALKRVTDVKAALPPALQEAVEIRGLEFRDGGAGALVLELTSEVRVPASEAAHLIDGLRLSLPKRL